MATSQVLPDAAVGQVSLGPVGAVAGSIFGGSQPGKSTNNDTTLLSMLQQMQSLKDQATQGQVSEADYSKGINDLVNQAFKFRNEFGSHGSQYANQVNPQWNKIVQSGFATSNGQPYSTLNPFKGTPYEGSQQLQDMLKSYSTAGKGPAQGAKEIQAYATTFQQMFNSAVGRDPTAQEYDQFFGNVVQNDQPWSKPLDQTQLRQETSGLLSQFYQGEAQKTAEQKLKDASAAAVAPGSAFDTWQQAYQGSLNDVEKSLTDFQTRLFEKIRPNLITSLKSQGLLDSGALNQAFSGAAGDLASATSNYMANARMGAATDIANQKYGLMSAPTTYQLNTASSNPANLSATGQSALQNVYGNMVNTNLANMNYNNQRSLLEQQYSNQPSLLSQYGGLILGGAAGGAGQKFGSMI